MLRRVIDNLLRIIENYLFWNKVVREEVENMDNRGTQMMRGRKEEGMEVEGHPDDRERTGARESRGTQVMGLGSGKGGLMRVVIGEGAIIPRRCSR